MRHVMLRAITISLQWALFSIGCGLQLFAESSWENHKKFPLLLQARDEQEAAIMKADMQTALKAAERGLVISVAIAGQKSLLKSRALREIGHVLSVMGEHARATEYYQQARAAAQEGFTGESEELAEAISRLGDNAVDRGDSKKGISLYSEALLIRRNLNEKNPQRIAYELTNLAEAYRLLGELNKALECHEEAISQFDKSPILPETELVAVYNSYALTLLRQRNPDAAERILEKAIDAASHTKPGPHKMLGSTYHHLGRVYWYRHSTDRAIEYYRTALEIDQKLYGHSHKFITRRLSSIAIALEDKNETEKALNLYQQIIKQKINTFGKNYPSLDADYHNLGRLFLKMKNHPEAIAIFQKQIGVANYHFGENHIETTMAYTNLGDAYLASKQYELAISHHERAYNIAKSVLGENHPTVEHLLNNLRGSQWAKAEHEKRTQLRD